MLLNFGKKIKTVLLAQLTLFVSASALAAPNVVECKGDHSVVTWITFDGDKPPLLIAKYRDEWAIANAATEMKVRSDDSEIEVTALASPVPDGSIEFITVTIPKVLPAGVMGPGRIIHSREYTFLENYPPRLEEESLICNSDGQSGLTKVKEVVSGTSVEVTNDFLTIDTSEMENLKLPLVRPATVIMDGSDMAGTRVLRQGTPVELLLDSQGRVLLINATRDVSNRIIPTNYDLECRTETANPEVVVYLVYETWGGEHRNFMRMIETNSDRSWSGEALILKPHKGDDGLDLPAPLAFYSARGPAVYQSLDISAVRRDGTYSGRYRRIARSFTEELPVRCWRH